MTVQQDWDQVEARDITALGAPQWVWGKPGAAAVKASGKRTFDFTFALILLTPLSFVIAAVALLLLVTQGRPIFYVAPRMRSLDRSFKHLKFRTMREQENDSGVTGAHKKWRITPLGHFLRRTRIDELPQLFNILKGDMSFVGPRPTIRQYVDANPSIYSQVLKSLPGVTGLATLIYHRHEDRILARCNSAEETEGAYSRRCLPTKLKIDLIYQRNQSLLLDLWIMWRTLTIVLYRDERTRRHKRRRAAPTASAVLRRSI